MSQRTSITPDLTALRALAHPTRLRMLGQLRTEGPATATVLAARFGLNTGATSYHLRQLAEHGLIVEDAERGNARDRWWRAAHQATRTDSSAATTPEEHDTYDGYLQAVGIVYSERLQQALEERRTLPPEWEEAWDISDWNLRLSPGRAKELVETVHALVDGWAEDEEATPGAARFTININAFRRPGAGAGPSGTGAA